MAFGSALGALGIGASIFQGQRQRQVERRARRDQQAAQQRAESRALAEERRAEEERRRLNRRRPDATSLLANQQRDGARGASGTLLTGPGGVNRGQLQLGRSSLLGGA